MKMLHQTGLRWRLSRRFILTFTILPAALSAHAFGIDWNGAVTLTIDPTVSAGLKEGRTDGDPFDLSSPNPMNGPDTGLGTGVSLGVRMGQSTLNFGDGSTADFDNFWNDYRTWIYTGEINSGPTGRLSFAESIDDNTQIAIDGVVVLNDGTLNPTATGILNFAPNTFHAFEVRLGNAFGSAGPVTVNNFTPNYGFGFSQTGGTGTDGANYAAPVDPGTGALFHFITADAADANQDISVLGNTTVTLAKVTNDHITENSITFAPAVAALTLTLNSDIAGQGRTLRSLSTTLATTNTHTITVTGAADFAPGALSTGPTAGAATLTGITLLKTGTGSLILDNPTNALAGTTIRVADGTLSIVGSGGTANPVSSLTTAIEIGGAGAVAPVLRIGSSGTTGTTFNNLFKATQNATLEHLTAATDTLSGATFGITSGKTLTVNVAAGGLAISGGIADPSNPAIRGGTLKKMGNNTTLTLSGAMRIAGLNVAEGRLEVLGQLNLSTNPVIGANATLSLQNTSAVTPNTITPATITIPTGTLEGLPGAFGATTNVLSPTGGTLNLGVNAGAALPGLTAHLYDTGSAAAQAAFGGPLNPAKTYTDYLTYFAGRGNGTATSTGAGGVTELSFGSGFGNTAMYAVLAPSYTRTDDIVSRFNGKIIITTPGLYHFATDSDDGSMLYIDGATVVSNNASQAHVRRTGNIQLSAGLHDIDIGYYEGTGLNGLIVDYTGPDTSDVQTVIPNSALVPSTELQLTFQNPITISTDSVINVTAVSVPSVTLSQAAKTLTVNGQRLDIGVLNLTGGAGTYTINSNTSYGQVDAKSIAAGNAVVALVNNGPGTLILDAPSSPQTMAAGSTVSVTNGALGLVLGGANSPTGNASIGVNGHGLVLSSVSGDQSMALPAFNLGGSITARKIGSGVAGAAATPIRMTLTGNLALDNATALSLGTADNYVLAMPGVISGNATVNINGTVETTGMVNVGGPLNVNVGSRLNVNGGSVTGGPIVVNSGATLSLGADDVLGNFAGGPSSVTVNGGNVSAVAGTHSTLPAVTLNGGTLGATGPGNAPTGPTINYILNGNVTTVPNATPSTISAPAIQLRGAGAPGPVTFTVPRGAAATDLAIASVVHDSGAGLIKSGDGIMSLSGVNTYTGPTVINAGTVVTYNPSALGNSAVTLNNGGTLSITSSQPTFTGFANVSLNGGATLDAANNIITLTTNVGNQARSVFTQSKYAVGAGFSASFVYTASGTRAADGVTFTVQNSSPTVIGGGGGQLGYVGIASSAALELNIYTGGGQPVGTNVAAGTAGSYIPSAPVNLASGNPIKVDVVYDSAALTFTENLTDQVTGAFYTNTFGVPALTSIIGGNLAYIGFTGATGGSVSTQTIGGFSFNNYTQTNRTLANNVTVSAGATGGLDVPQAGPGAGSSAALTGILTLNAGSTLNTTSGTNATDTPYLLDVTGSTTLAGNSTINVANNGIGLGTLHLDDVNQSGGNNSLTKTGAGTLVLSGALNFSVLNSDEGTTNLNSTLANATINADGGTLNVHANQTLAALNISSTGVVVLGGGAQAAPAFDAETATGDPGGGAAEDGAGASGDLADGAVQAVPEPASTSLLLLGVLGLLGRHRKRA